MGSRMFVGQEVHVVPVIAPVDITTTTTNTIPVGVKEYEAIEFIILFGAITTDTAVLKVYECDDTTPTTSTAIAFKYRKTSAVGTDMTGALTAGTSSGITIAVTDDNKCVLVDVDPAALTSGYPYVKLSLDPGASMTVCVLSAIAILKPRYPQAVQISAVD